MKDKKEVVKNIVDSIEKNLEKEINLDTIAKIYPPKVYRSLGIFTGKKNQISMCGSSAFSCRGWKAYLGEAAA